MKILHLPVSVGGHGRGLSLAERKLGLQSDSLTVDTVWLGYESDFAISLEDSTGWQCMKKYIEIFGIIKRYDVLHFNFGRTLLNNSKLHMYLYDLPLYKRKKLFVSYNGCDARQKYARMQQTENCACKYEDCYNGVCNSGLAEQTKKKKIQRFEEAGASFFSVNPDLCRFLPRETIFLPYAIPNWDMIQTIAYKPIQKTIHIVHAPTQRACKGSDIIIETVNRLMKRYALTFTLVENVPNNKAIQIYAQADLIIDQIRLGWYGAFAVEAIKMGKPVVVYINQEDLCFIPDEMRRDCLNAFFCVDSSNLEQELENILDNPYLLAQKREAGMEYIYKWHNPTYVAGITKSCYEK